MARKLGTLGFTPTFEIHSTAPIDARTLVPTVAELSQKATWVSDDGGIWLYNNIVVTV